MEVIYSFVGWIATLVVYVCFLLWAFLPEEWLHNVGITYYPSRYYAIALPAWLIVVWVLVGVSYMGYNMLHTVDPADFRSFRDDDNRERSVPLVCQRFGVGEGIPDVGDIDPVELSKLWK